jgi:hypothetical protein
MIDIFSKKIMIDIHSISTKDIYTYTCIDINERSQTIFTFIYERTCWYNELSTYIYVLYLFTISIFFWKLITFLFLMTNKQICQTEVEKVNTQLIVQWQVITTTAEWSLLVPHGLQRRRSMNGSKLSSLCIWQDVAQPDFRRCPFCIV